MKILQSCAIAHMECGPTQIAFIDAKDDLYMLGKQLNQTWLEPTYVLSNVKCVSLGKDFALIITKQGFLHAFGSNAQG